MNLEQARFNMIEQQIRPWNVLDPKILKIMRSIPRHQFVPIKSRLLAYADIQIPLAHHEFMMHPRVEGRMLQSLAVKPKDTCLEIGTGSGYMTACLAKLAPQGKVYSFDLYKDFTAKTRKKLDKLIVRNVSLSTGDATHNYDPEPSIKYDVIMITAAMPIYRSYYERRLKDGGRLFIIVGKPPVISAMLVTRIDETWSRKKLFETELQPLVGAEPMETFSF